MITFHDFASTVGVAQVDFQGEVTTTGTVSEPLSTYLRTESFPLSAPPSLRGATDYGGIKIFSYQAKSICVARFYDAGKKDSFQRAVASASVLIFPFDMFARGFRNLRAIREFLTDLAANGLDRSTLTVLHSLYEEAHLAVDARELVSVCKQRGVDYELLADAVGLLAANRKLKICTPDRTAGLAYLELLYHLLPDPFFSLAWCSYASTLNGSHEEVIVHDCQFAPVQEDTSWLGGMKARLFGANDPVEAGIDLRTGVPSIPDRKDARYRIARKLVLELRDNVLRLPLAFEARQLLLTSVIANIARHTTPEIFLKVLLPDDPSLTSDIRSRFEEFLKAELTRRT